MRIIFCNIAWMKYYCGPTNDDKPINGGVWVDENNEGGECWNFSAVDGKCYGYVATKSNRGRANEPHIKKIEGVMANQECAGGVLVVWVAREARPDGKNVVVGWYKNATIYREYLEDENGWPINIVANDEDCVLLPISKRHRIVPRAGKQGYKYGMGQSNIWFAQDENAKEYVRLCMEFINNYSGDNWINR